jgi:prepilin signal peptidase PulO-like enzyme (type II secretory pathway)
MIILILIVLGLCFGSFVNAFVYRFYENNKSTFTDGKPKISKDKKLSIMNGRSICPHCKHQLSWIDLIPVFSWLSLRGHCRYCDKLISYQYPVVEAITAVLFVISYIYWPVDFDSSQIVIFGFWLVYLVGFMALTIFDVKWMILPNKVVYTLTLLFVVQVAVVLVMGGYVLQDVASMALGGVVLSGFFWLLFQVSKGKWIGGGDVKLAVLLGLLAGSALKAFLVIFIASLLGTVVGGLTLYFAKKFKLDKQIPFGPYLMAATFIVVLWGSVLVKSYMQLIG